MIKFENVTKQYFDKWITTTVLNDINLTIHEGEIIGIVGHSGAGKNTLLGMINGLIPPTKRKYFSWWVFTFNPKNKSLSRGFK